MGADESRVLVLVGRLDHLMGLIGLAIDLEHAKTTPELSLFYYFSACKITAVHIIEMQSNGCSGLCKHYFSIARQKLF